MNWFKRMIRWAERKKAVQLDVKAVFKADHHITEAFTLGGVTYYQMDDVFNMPYERAMTALTFYDEFKSRIDRDFLKELLASIKTCINAKTIELTKIVTLINFAEERLNWIHEPDLAYKLASVVYFDKTESPYVYDHLYNQKKIENWKKHSTTHAFFLQKPLSELIPFLHASEVNLDSYSEILQAQKELQQQFLSSLKSA